MIFPTENNLLDFWEF